MGCGSSSTKEAPTDPATNPVIDRIVSFKDFTEEPAEDNLLEPASKSRNAYSAMHVLQELTDEEKKAAIDRSLQIRPATAAAPGLPSEFSEKKKHYFPTSVPNWDEPLQQPLPAGRKSEEASQDSFPELRRPALQSDTAAAKKLEPMFPEIRRPPQQFGSSMPNSFYNGDSKAISTDAVPQAILQLEKNQREKTSANKAVPVS